METVRPNPIVPLIDEDTTPARHRNYSTVLRDGWNPRGAWDPESTIGRFLIDVRAGATPYGAARHLNIPFSTLQTWVARGRSLLSGKFTYKADQRLYMDFVQALDRCEGAYEVELSSVVRRGAHDNPRMALDVLTKRFSADGWAPDNPAAAAPTTINVTNIDLGALMSDPEVLESAASVADRIAELEAGGAVIVETTAIKTTDGQPA